MKDRLVPALVLLVFGLVMSSVGLGWFVARAVLTPGRSVDWLSLGLPLFIIVVGVAQIFSLFSRAIGAKSRAKAIDGR